jgi:hypothetical protein
MRREHGRTMPLADEVPVLNTHVAKMQSAATSDVCTATTLLLTGLGGDGSFPPETASVLIFEMGQMQTLESDAGC